MCAYIPLRFYKTLNRYDILFLKYQDRSNLVLTKPPYKVPIKYSFLYGTWPASATDNWPALVSQLKCLDHVVEFMSWGPLTESLFAKLSEPNIIGVFMGDYIRQATYKGIHGLYRNGW